MSKRTVVSGFPRDAKNAQPLSDSVEVYGSPIYDSAEHEDFQVIVEKKDDVLADLAQYAGAFSMPVHEAKAALMALAERAKAQLGK